MGKRGIGLLGHRGDARAEAKKLQANPARLVEHRKEDNARTVFLGKNDEVKLRARIHELYPEREPEFDLALYTGMRRGEQYSATWQDVDWERRQLTIPLTKNGSMRHLPLNASAMRALASLRSRAGDSVLICGGVKSPRGWFEPAVKAAGLRGFTWHSIRHTFASRLVMAGVGVINVGQCSSALAAVENMKRKSGTQTATRDRERAIQEVMDVVTSFQQSQATVFLSVKLGVCAFGYAGKITGVYREDGAFAFAPDERGPHEIIVAVRESKTVASMIGMVILDDLFVGSDPQQFGGRTH